ncbi:hypothetical protein IEQ34_003808 [Dendrobium chrysotoxum]|uniref:Uncharacterized protein n=1 Tax=Dendrobium chrysotoxum TaxID=161865 RepID=A0AAV7HEL6_DENCH|nr:hypothetical protein IEQ34_003808 [Dendrobium chrysotoxum]
MDPILSHGKQTSTASTGLQTHEKPANAKASKDFIKRRSLTPDLQVPKASQLSKRVSLLAKPLLMAVPLMGFEIGAAKNGAKEGDL